MTVQDRLAGIFRLNAVRTWFSMRSLREQVLLFGFLLVGIAAVLVLAIWRPLTLHRAEALSKIERYDALLARARMAGPDALAVATASVGDPDNQSIGGSAASHGLLIRRIEPEADYTRVVFEDADFTRILDWIASMEGSGVARLVAIQLDRRPEPGTVNAQVTLEDQ